MISFVPWTRAPAAPADEAELASRVGRGDRAALDAIYRRQAGPVYRYVLALSGNPAWAADATQEAFVSFAQRPWAFDPARGSLGAYLAGTARHALLATLRRGGIELGLDSQATDGDGDAAAPESLLVARQDGERLWRAIRALPWPLREALVLVDVQERSYQEAAQIAGIELNTLRTRVHRARLRLARQLNDTGASG